MPIATDTLADPKIFPITVGMVAKNPPFAAPLTTTKSAKGARVVEAGHRASILTALRKKDIKRVFKGPSLSQRNPQKIRPTADEKLKPARRPAPVLDERPMDRL